LNFKCRQRNRAPDDLTDVYRDDAESHIQAFSDEERLGALAMQFRVHQLREFPERCPRMTCSTNSSPNRLVNGPERNNKR
jgi:hypothetical protein